MGDPVTAAADRLRSLLAEARMEMMNIPPDQFENVTRPILTGFAASVKEMLGQTRGGGAGAAAGGMAAGAGAGAVAPMPGRGLGAGAGASMPGRGGVGGGIPGGVPQRPM